MKYRKYKKKRVSRKRKLISVIDTAISKQYKLEDVYHSRCGTSMLGESAYCKQLKHKFKKNNSRIKDLEKKLSKKRGWSKLSKLGLASLMIGSGAGLGYMGARMSKHFGSSRRKSRRKSKRY